MTLTQAKKVFEKIPPPCGQMRVNDAAAVAGLNPETVRRRIRRGEIGAWGRPHRVLIDDLLPQYEPRDSRK